MFVTVSLTFNASSKACGQSDGKPEDLQGNLQNHMQCCVVAPFKAIDTSEEAQKQAQEKVKIRSTDTQIELQLQKRSTELKTKTI